MALFGTLKDSFTGPTLDTTLWDYAGDVTMTGTAARLASPDGSPSFISSINEYDLAESSVAVRAVNVDVGDGVFVMSVDGGGCGVRHEYSITNGLLWMYARLLDTDEFSTTTAIPYDPTAHTWMRIRQSGTTTVFDTSPDGRTWTDQFTVADSVPIGGALLSLWVSAASTPATVDIDAVNGYDTSILRVRAENGMLLVATEAQPLYLRGVDGWLRFPGAQPLYQRQPDGAWTEVA